MSANRELQRIEAFSDGVFAIAVTLLILEIKVPHVEDLTGRGALWTALKAAWPSFLAFLLAFWSIFVTWTGHHTALRLLTGSSKAFLFANGLLLLAITFMPFPTAVLAEYIDTPQANTAVMFFTASWFFTNVAFLVWWISMHRPVMLLPASMGRDARKTVTVRQIVSFAVSGFATIIAWWLPVVAVITILVTPVTWIALSLGEHE